MSKAKYVFIFIFCAFGIARANTADWLNAGFLYDDFSLTLDPGHRTEAVGPFFYSEQKDTQKTWAIPPLFSYVHDPVVESTEWDLAYPVISYDRYGSEYRWQLFQVFSFSGGQNPDDDKAKRFTLFPIYFQQRSPNPEENYTAVVPIYGHLKNRLLRDEIFFVMFPLFSETRKKDVVTDNYLYPIFHLRHGDGLHGWQVWPLVGHEHKDVTTKTNGFGDVEVVGGHDNSFVIWPLFFNARSGIGTTNEQHLQALIPFYIIQRSTNRDSTTIGPPPFFSLFTVPASSKSGRNNGGSKAQIPLINPFNVTHTVDREKKYTEWDAPWPLIVFARGTGKHTSRVFPFYSHAYNDVLESDFYLWPIYKYSRVHSDPLDRTRTRILLFLYSDVNQKNTETGHAQRRIDLLPFFTYKRDYNGSSRLQILAPLEPILPNSKSIERDYSPLWSIWRAEKNTETGARSQSFLWNLYRRDTTPNTKKCSLLFGLFQYQSGSTGKQMRLFYIPVVKTKPVTETGSK